MSEKIALFCKQGIQYSFYFLLFFVPFVFTNDNSELFELNKIWLTYAVSLVILGLWITEILLKAQVRIKRTPLDIPIGLFLLSQILSTIFSLDKHISFWGYYSRFNGGLLSFLSFAFLYYAFVSHLDDNAKPTKENGFLSQFPKPFLFLVGLILIPVGLLFSAPPPTSPDSGNPLILYGTLLCSFFLFVYTLPKNFLKRTLGISLISGVIVSLWGLPSHFGYDPTCFLFRGTFNVECWTFSFHPTVRIFSTIGQPAWLGSYLALLMPLAVSYFLVFWSNRKNPFLGAILLGVVSLFYADIMYSNTRSAFAAIVAGMGLFTIFYLWIALKASSFSSLFSRSKYYLGVLGILGLITWYIGIPAIPFFNNLSFSSLSRFLPEKTLPQKPPPLSNPVIPQPTSAPSQSTPPTSTSLETAGTESGTIRYYVWSAALNAWRANPILGTGVETFAFAFYKYKPQGHNLTSEWDFLYNKAHNEYLNYLATTGTFGLLSYIAILGVFMLITLKYILFNKHEDTNVSICIAGLLAGFVTILVANFGGFSVVITNIYLFLIPAFVFVMGNMLTREFVFNLHKAKDGIDTGTSMVLILSWIVISFSLYSLYISWLADKSYAYGYNLDRTNAYDKADAYLKKAVAMRNDEPVFKDELSINNALLATSFALKKDAPSANSYAVQAVQLNTELVTKFPNNVIFWKTRTRVFSTLAQVDSRYLANALEAILKARELAPNDPKITYSVGVLYAQNNNLEKAVETLSQTIEQKPNYWEAYYALGLVYHALATNDKGVVVHPEIQKKAVAQMKTIMKNLEKGPGEQARDALKSWGEL